MAMSLSLSLSLTATRSGGGDYPFPPPPGFRWQQVFYGAYAVQRGLQNVYTLERII